MTAIDVARVQATRGVDLSVWPPRYDGAWRPAPDAEHWLPEVECAPPAARDALILAKLQEQVRYAWKHSPFYQRRWAEAGVSPDSLKTLEDLLVRAEYAATHASGDAQARLSAIMRERLRARLGVRPRVELVAEGTLPRSEFKARRVIDDRDLYRRTLAT